MVMKKLAKKMWLVFGMCLMACSGLMADSPGEEFLHVLPDESKVIIKGTYGCYVGLGYEIAISQSNAVISAIVNDSSEHYEMSVDRDAYQSFWSYYLSVKDRLGDEYGEWITTGSFRGAITIQYEVDGCVQADEISIYGELFKDDVFRALFEKYIRLVPDQYLEPIGRYRYVVGPSWFAEGNRISVCDVGSLGCGFESGDVVVVYGKYRLDGCSEAEVVLRLISPDGREGMHTNVLQETKTTVTGEEGCFELGLVGIDSGYLNLSLQTADGTHEELGVVYFGTKKQMRKVRRLGLVLFDLQ